MADQITADGVGDNPFEMAKAAKPRKRSGGIGHNSGVTTEVLPENVSLETISERLAIAQVKVVEYDAAWRSSTAEVEKKATETISAIYLVSHEIQVAGAYDQFMAKYGLSVHGNVRSRSRPIVNFCFLQMDRSYAKSTITKWSMVVDYGIAAGLSPEQFADLVSSTGIENLYQQHKPGTQKDTLTTQQNVDLTAAILQDRPDAPAFYDRDSVENGFGLRLAVLDGDGKGNFRVVKVLSDPPREVTRFLAQKARKKLGL